MKKLTLFILLFIFVLIQNIMAANIPVTPVSGGGTGSKTALGAQGNLFGLPNFRAKIAAQKTNAGNTRACFVGDSTTYGAYSSNNASTGDVVVGSFPTQLSALITNNYGINSERNSFLGGGTTGLNNVTTNDNRVVVGSSWSLDATIISFGGDTLKATTSTNALTFTPATPTASVDTFKVLYVTQSGGGVLSLDIDGGTASLFNTTGSDGLAIATITGTLATHTLNIKWSSGGQVNVVGVLDAYDSTQKWLSVVNMGWPGSATSDWAASTKAYNPGNAASWAIIGCDLINNGLGINDIQLAVGTSTFNTNYQSILAAETSATTDLVLMTPNPTTAGGAFTQAIQQSYVNVITALSSITLPVIDNFKRWGSFTNAGSLLLTQVGGSQLHPNYNGYMDFANTVVRALLDPITPAKNGLGAPNTLYNSATQPPLTLINSTTSGTALVIANTAGHSFQLVGGGSSNPTNMLATDNTTGPTNLWAASTTLFGLNSAQSLGWSASTTAAGNSDTMMFRLSTGVFGFGNGSATANKTEGLLETGGYATKGIKFTSSGCSISATTGGASSGTYTSGTTGICTAVITMNGASGLTAPAGWTCFANDQTTPANPQVTTATTATTATITGTTVSGDVVSFGCMGY